MQLAVFGGTGRTGQALIDVALAHGANVRALVRTQRGAGLPLPPGLGIVHGDPERASDVATTLHGADAVCCVFGPRPPYDDPFCAGFTRRVVEAMRAEGVGRLVCLTGAMVGARAANLSPAMRALAALVDRRYRWLAADRAEQESVVMASGLAWTIVKPPRLTDAPPCGEVHADPALAVGLLSSIGRADLAEFLYRTATHDRFVMQRVYVHG
jgi:uncharacterized protein YbjT (DUF2867 family)